ncbi:MAG: hypothetical protein IKR09_02830 [Alphaproteobacteria bacterium]|nr:hypothetical protein [Alphaproteobacteria bacterium]
MATEFLCSFKARMTACFAAVVLIFVLAPLLFSSTAAPYWFHDRFFNTLQIAINFREKGFPTFDGVTLTNDFSLIWGMLLCGLSAVISPETAVFFLLVRLLLGAVLGVSLWLFDKLADALGFPFEKEVRFLTYSFLTALFLYVASTGSDAVWAIPCILLNSLCLLKALRNPSLKSGLAAGLTVSLCAFARFDGAAFFAAVLLVFYFQFNDKYPVSKKQALILFAGIVAGLIPLMVYADIWQTKFGSPVPAELLRWGKAQDTAPWRLLSIVFFEPVRYAFLIPQSIALITFPVALLLLVAYVSFPWQGQPQKPEDTIFYALIWYPIIYLGVLATVTFLTLPDYAFYPFTVGAPFALLFAAGKINAQISEKEKKQARRAWVILGGLLILLSLGRVVKPQSAVYSRVVQEVAGFSGNHSGRYAMGVGAGITSFMAKTEIVRLDGAAEDLTLLKMIEAQEPLDKAFKRFGVNYYIAVNIEKGKDCYSAREPVQNRFGGSNKGMSDWLCAKPVFEKKATPDIKIAIFAIDVSGKAISDEKESADMLQF